LSVGAEEVARAIETHARQRGLAIELVRNGSRGLYWVEPMIEVATPTGRHAYGPVRVADVPGLFTAGFLEGRSHPLHLGPTAQIPWLASQQRLSFERVGVVDPLSIEDYESIGGFAGLKRALEIGPEAALREVADSGLRGRGGAAFPTGIKWRT